MARDHALARTLAPGTAILRLYRWRTPTVSLGRNEPARGLYDRAAAARLGIGFVRRPTGGRCVLHQEELTYAVLLPAGALGGPRRAYRRIHAGLVRALVALGVPAELAGGERTPPPSAGPCFALAAPGEVTVAGRKLVGSAQARLEGALLQHGSLLLAPGQDALEALRTGATCGPATAAFESVAARGAGDAAAASLREVLGAVPPWEALARAVTLGMAAEVEGAWSDCTVAVDEGAEATLRRNYASPAWTWRR